MNRECENCLFEERLDTETPCNRCADGDQFEHKTLCQTCKYARTEECEECREFYPTEYREDKDKHRPESEEPTCYWCSYYHDDVKEPADSYKRFKCANCRCNYPLRYERDEWTMNNGRDYEREFWDGVNLREECLRKANECVNQSRRDKYGELEDNFQTIASLWNAYIGAIAEDHCELTSFDVAIMMNLLKVGRAATGIDSDNLVDMAGYAACAYELMGGAEDE